MMHIDRKVLFKMKFVATHSLLLRVFLSLIGPSLLSAHEKGFVGLFNGKDLSGWHIDKKAPFKIRDGVIYVEGVIP